MRSIKEEGPEDDLFDWLEDTLALRDFGVVRAPSLSAMNAYPNPFLGQEGVSRLAWLSTAFPGVGESVLIRFMTCS